MKPSHIAITPTRPRAISTARFAAASAASLVAGMLPAKAATRHAAATSATKIPFSKGRRLHPGTELD
jgi:hypothetical protein